MSTNEPAQVPVGPPTPPADAVSTGSRGDNDTRFFGQPWALAHVFGVEMWERFSFYGMQGILLLYLYYSVADGGLGMDQTVAAGIVGAYGGSVYLSTILGAWIADRVLGSERVLFYSAMIIVAGHIALALLPGFAGVTVGLMLVALGSGGLKANATSVVGTLYRQDDPRRDAGFSLFYLGINLGALLGPLLTGLLQSTLGFHWGFGLAAIGMALGLLQYSFGRKSLPDESRHVPNPLPRSRYPMFIGIAVAAVALILVLVLTGVIRADNLSSIVIYVTIAATLAYFVVILSSRHITGTERSRVWAFVPLFITSVAFWSLYQQQFTVVTIYADTKLDRDIFGFEMPVPWVQSINPIFIIILSGVFAWLWTKLGARQPSTPVKFGLGVMIMGAAFLLFLPFANGGDGSTPLIAMIGILLVFTVAELLLSPVGLSVTTKLAPERFHTQMVALFFLSVALGTAISGQLAQYYNPENEVPYFSILGLIAIGVGVVLLLLVKPVLRLMQGVR
ncbi:MULTISPECIES: peptide MFS transporter [unclassified Microbacterium]|uniref:peptide MFS transporter n=1 Tax=unclassified Microbacterium TaxID=2609290 RepID=UPI00214AD0FC|nr:MULTISPECIES: peptide MFS transporter [unclassified Microbacterium]MCR2783310.1 peptide MFS transporter [Microbacterium sp. zg.B96]MDL5351906.1 peptide MFS transporter [Microbacterium sp. zg-YB36]WIM15815.1 peptide MFS transporter [Microbacterium sp. zg-B96]